MKCHTCFNSDPNYDYNCAKREEVLSIFQRVWISMFGCREYIEESKYCKRIIEK